MKTDESYSEYMYNFVDLICEKFGPRYSCSEAEKKANIWIKDELDKFCDETFLDEFETHPGLYPLGIFKSLRLLGAISFIFIPLKFPGPLFASICIFAALFIFLTELFLMKEWISFLFKKGTSSNVFGIIKPSGDTKFRIIFEGHTDSAVQMNIAKFKEKAPIKRVVLGFYFLIHTVVLSFVKFFGQLSGSITSQAEWGIFSWTIVDWIYFIPFIVLLPMFLWAVGGFLGSTVVLGANDNLSGSAVSAAIGKYLSEHRPKNIEVWVGSQGSEEVGDKGAKAFVAKYGKELGKLDTAYAIVLDSAGAGTEIFIIHKDLMHRATHSMEIIERIQKAHETVKKADPDVMTYSIGKTFLGSSDACRYAHAGYKTVSMIVMDGALKKPRNWHSIDDIPENLEKKVLKDLLEICLAFVELVDREYES
jgi:hypothetical protein